MAERLTRLGTATVSEAAGGGVIDVDLIQSVPGSKVAGRRGPFSAARATT